MSVLLVYNDWSMLLNLEYLLIMIAYGPTRSTIVTRLLENTAHSKFADSSVESNFCLIQKRRITATLSESSKARSNNSL